MLPLEDSISLCELAAGTNSWFNVTGSVRDALEQLVKHASSQNRRIRHLEEALQRVESSSGRKHDKFEGRVDKLLEELESVRACAVDSSIQSDDIRYRVQQLELKLFGCGLDGSHSRESPGGRPRSSLGHRRGPAGLAVLDRLDSLERSVDSVSKVANKAKDEFEASNACAYEMEKRLEERFVEVRADVSLATAECKQQTLSEVVHTTKLQLDNLQERFTNRIQGIEEHQQAELASAAQQAEARVAEAELELGAKLKALSHLADHTAKAGSQTMTHLAQLESQTKADLQGLDEAVQRLDQQKVDTSGMDNYTQDMSKLFEDSARRVRKEAVQHADALHQAMQQQLQSRLQGKADAAALQSESQSSRQQLSELWAEAEGAREGLEGLKATLQTLDATANSTSHSTKERLRKVEEKLSQGQEAVARVNSGLSAESSRRQDVEQEVQSLSGAVAVVKEALYGPALPTTASASRSRPASPARHVAANGSLIARVAATAERVEGVQAQLQHKADQDSLQEARQQLSNSVHQQSQQSTQALADLKGHFRQQGQDQATALNRLEALITTCAHERATSREVRQWVEAAAREGQQGLSSRLGPVENALQALTQAVDEGRAHAASVAGDYTPQELQLRSDMHDSKPDSRPQILDSQVQALVERAAEGLQGVQRQLASLQQTGEEGLNRQGAELRERLQDLHHHYHRQQDLLQVTGENLREVVREVGGRVTPQEACTLVRDELQDRDQKDADKWQGLVQRFTAAFEETKQKLQEVTSDLGRSLSLGLAAKLNSEDLPQKLQDANLVNRVTMSAHLKQVEGSCQRLCGSLGGEVHRLALQLQVLEEADTLNHQAEADINHLRKAISKKADKESVEADLERIHQALRCKANVHAMSEALSQKLDIHTYLTGHDVGVKIPAYDPSSSIKRGVK